MSNEKFTQGKWRAVNDSVFCGKELIAQAIGGDLYKYCTSARYQDACKNANLISAAPDMYRALQKVISYQGEHMEDWLHDECVAALAKADGEV